MLILPEKQFVAMLDTPVTSRITFTQFLANVSGSVKCLGMVLWITYLEYNFIKTTLQKTVQKH